MSIPTVLIDANVALYALGEDSPWRAPCRHLFELLGQNCLVGVVSVEMLQEVVHHRLRMTGNRSQSVAEVRDLMTLVDAHSFDSVILDTALTLIERTHVRGRDAVHAATATVLGVEAIISTDTVFDSLPDLTRIHPSDVDIWMNERQGS